VPELGIVESGLLHRGFPAQYVLSGRFQVCQSLAVGGLNAAGTRPDPAVSVSRRSRLCLATATAELEPPEISFTEGP